MIQFCSVTILLARWESSVQIRSFTILLFALIVLLRDLKQSLSETWTSLTSMIFCE